jgi:hypothetical protein
MRAGRSAHKTHRRPRVRPAGERGAAGRSARRVPLLQAAARPGGQPEGQERFSAKSRAGFLTRSPGPNQGGSVARTKGKLGQPHPSPRLGSAKVGLPPTPDAGRRKGGVA